MSVRKTILGLVLLLPALPAFAQQGGAPVYETRGNRSLIEDDGLIIPGFQLASSPLDDPLFLLAQQPEAVEEEPPAAAAAEPEPSRRTQIRQLVASRRYRPSGMFGDFFDGGQMQLTIQQQPIPIQSFVGSGLFVTNRNLGLGADPNPAVVIEVRNALTGDILTSSIAPGMDTTSDGRPDSYAIGEPMIAGVSPPVVGPGTLVYDGGNAQHTGSDPVGDPNNWQLNFRHTFTPDPVIVNVASGGGVRRIKISENNSPVPQHRLIFNYNFFNDVIGGFGDVNRYSLGFEQTFFDDLASIEVLFPFASTLAANQFVGTGPAGNTEYGNLIAVLKAILIERDAFLISGGLGGTLPTADDSRVFNPNNVQILQVENQGVHLLPFLAFLADSGSGWFLQAFAQVDVDLNGNPVWGLQGNTLQRAGKLQDQTLLFADLGVGYWLTGSPFESGTPAVAATAEVHYATTLDDADTAQINGLSVTSLTNRFDVVNLTLGANVLLTRNVAVRPAMVIPLSEDDDEQFDYEAMVQMNVYR